MNNYYVDEYSRMSWVKFMFQKSDVLDILPEWKEQVELESGERVIKVRSDCAPELKKAISKLKAILECTTANTPEQNGKAERMNRSIVTKARSMLAGPGLPKRLWAEAMATACYLRNLTPSVNKHKSPYEIWTGQRPNVAHLKVFGCVAYVHIDKRKRDKLDLNAKRGIFVGYQRTTKQYRILDPKTGRIIESSHVTFKEDQKGSSIMNASDKSVFYSPSDKFSDEMFDQEEQLKLIDFPPHNVSASSAGRICENDYSLDIESRVDTATTEHPFQRPQRIKNPPNGLIEELGRCTNEESGKKGSAEMALFAKIPEP